MMKIFTQTFWYDVVFRCTYFKFLGRKGTFSRNEVNEIKKEFRKILVENGRMRRDVYSEFHLAWCSALLATYNACRRKNMSMDKAVEWTANAVFENMRVDEIASRVRKALDKTEDPFKTLVGISKYQEKNYYGNTFGYARQIDGDDRYLCLFHKCFYNDFFRANKVPELMRVACEWDLISWSQGIVPEKHHVRFTRAETLGLNGKNCPFDFVRIK